MTASTILPLGPTRPRLRVSASVARFGVANIIAAAICAILILASVFASWLAPFDPAAPDVLMPLAPPSTVHPLGTDETGRDIFSRLLYGGRSTLGGAAIIVAISAVAGTTIAIAAAWFGGWVDALVSRVTDIMFAFPGILIAILIVAITGPGFIAPVVALSLAYLPSVIRVLRSVAMRERALPYIDALRVQGVGGWRISTRHILPHVLPYVFVQAAVGFAYAMVDLSAISFIGLGLQPPATDWGLMIAQGKPALLNGNPEQALSASVVMLVAVVSFTLVGERLAQVVEKRPS